MWFKSIFITGRHVFMSLSILSFRTINLAELEAVISQPAGLHTGKFKYSSLLRSNVIVSKWFFDVTVVARISNKKMISI
jgi:hypothetical protein